jgi:hypothetical protein
MHVLVAIHVISTWQGKALYMHAIWYPGWIISVKLAPAWHGVGMQRRIVNFSF